MKSLTVLFFCLLFLPLSLMSQRNGEIVHVSSNCWVKTFPFDPNKGYYCESVFYVYENNRKQYYSIDHQRRNGAEVPMVWIKKTNNQYFDDNTMGASNVNYQPTNWDVFRVYYWNGKTTVWGGNYFYDDKDVNVDLKGLRHDGEESSIKIAKIFLQDALDRDLLWRN